MTRNAARDAETGARPETDPDLVVPTYVNTAWIAISDYEVMFDFSVRAIATDTEGQSQIAHRHVARIAMPIKTAIQMAELMDRQLPAMREAATGTGPAEGETKERETSGNG